MALALGGGGVPSRGLAGSSAGALAAAAWVFGHKDPWRVHEAIFDREVAELSRAGSLRALARLFIAFRRPAVVDTDRIEEGLKALFGEARLEESPIPLALQAADLLTGEAVVLREGPVWKAVLASMAIPGLFPPVALMGRLLVDGDVVEKALLPKAVAVDVSNPPPKAPPRTALEAALLAGEASRRRLKALALKEADVVIALDPPFPIDTFDHERLEFVYELGKHRAKERLPEVLALARTRLRDLLPRR